MSAGVGLAGASLAHAPWRAAGTSTIIQWDGTDESFIPLLMVALQTTIPELFFVAIIILALSVVTAWCYGRGYLKFSFEVGNSVYAKKIV